MTKLFGGSIHSALVHAVTEYDRRESKKRYYNHYALGQYLARVAIAGSSLRRVYRPLARPSFALRR